jgi:hypothetical protein
MLGSDPLMARHRKRPDSRQEAPGRDRGPAAPGAPDRRLGSAMRRVVVTPTFAAGLGVVVAAALAYPMQTVFSYVAPGATGQGGVLCGQGGCGHEAGAKARPAPFGSGHEAGAKAKPAPFGSGSGTLNPAAPGDAGQDGNGAPAGSGRGGSGGTTAALPQLSYKITSRWQGGFWGQIIITFPGTVPAHWHLRFGYPGGHIMGTNPDSHLAPNGHAATVSAADYPGGPGPGRHTFTVGVSVQGVRAHPARCSFDGQICHIS